MTRKRRNAIRRLARFHAARILKTAIEGWDPEFELDEEEMVELEAEITRVANRLEERS